MGVGLGLRGMEGIGLGLEVGRYCDITVGYLSLLLNCPDKKSGFDIFKFEGFLDSCFSIFILLCTKKCKLQDNIQMALNETKQGGY